MKFGFSAPTFGDYHERTLASLAADAEEASWDGFFLWDHVLWDPFGHGMSDTTVSLTAVALSTERIRIGALVTALARRRPWKFAREIVSLDRLSGGRVVVGVGGGDDVDFLPVGDAATPGERAGRLDESLEIVTRLWAGEPVTYAGRYYDLDGATILPRPVQQPRPPIWVGGWWPNEAPFRRGARWDGVVPVNREAPDRPLSADAVRACIEFVRDARGDASFDVVVTAMGEDPEPYEQAGATWWLSGGDPWNDSIADVRARVRAGPPR